MAATASGVIANTGASALTLATAKFAYLNRASAARLPATAAASQRRRRRASFAVPIARPMIQLNATEPTISGR